MAKHFAGLTYGIELWRGGIVIAVLVVLYLKLLVVSRPRAMLDEVTTPSPVQVAEEN